MKSAKQYHYGLAFASFMLVFLFPFVGRAENDSPALKRLDRGVLDLRLSDPSPEVAWWNEYWRTNGKAAPSSKSWTYNREYDLYVADNLELKPKDGRLFIDVDKSVQLDVAGLFEAYPKDALERRIAAVIHDDKLIVGISRNSPSRILIQVLGLKGEKKVEATYTIARFFSTSELGRHRQLFGLHMQGNILSVVVYNEVGVGMETIDLGRRQAIMRFKFRHHFK